MRKLQSAIPTQEEGKVKVSLFQHASVQTEESDLLVRGSGQWSVAATRLSVLALSFDAIEKFPAKNSKS